MRVVVVGRGIGGLCMASALSKAPFINEIRVIGDDAGSYSHGYTGLWGPALQALEYLTPLNEFDVLRNKVEFIGNSGFTSMDGRMLASPLTKPNLGFIKNDDLSIHLKQITGDNAKIIPENDTVTSVNPVINEVSCMSGKKYQADLIVGADGMNSTVRDNVYNVKNFLIPKRYNVYRGHSTKRITPNAFQTWGPGIRFATVPTKTGNCWFITEPGDDVTRNVQCHRGALSNNSFIISDSEYNRLQTLVSTFHKPIHEILSHTNTEIVVNHAIATDHKLYIDNSNDTRVALIGDAFYVQDPILAQGLNVCIEDSTLFLFCLLESLNGDKRVDSGSNYGEIAKLINMSSKNTYKSFDAILPDAISLFYKRKYKRINKLFYLTQITNALGMLSTHQQCKMRDFILDIFPNSVKGLLFDRSIAHSIDTYIR